MGSECDFTTKIRQKAEDLRPWDYDRKLWVSLSDVLAEFDKHQKQLQDLLKEYPKFRSFNHITQKFAEEDDEIKAWLKKFGELVNP